jgi:hypothetical protein
MDTGKILIGIALVMFSAALMATPSSAAGNDSSRQVGNGSTVVIIGALTPEVPYPSGAAGMTVMFPAQAAACMKTGDK